MPGARHIFMEVMMYRNIMLILTLILSGRAMTLAFIHRTGGTMPGDPPNAWLMPLIGDAIIGITALWIAFLKDDWLFSDYTEYHLVSNI